MAAAQVMAMTPPLRWLGSLEQPDVMLPVILITAGQSIELLITAQLHWLIKRLLYLHGAPRQSRFSAFKESQFW